MEHQANEQQVGIQEVSKRSLENSGWHYINSFFFFLPESYCPETKEFWTDVILPTDKYELTPAQWEMFFIIHILLSAET